MPHSDTDWDRVHRSNYERAAFWDINWISTARHLYECAKTLEPEVAAVWESYRAKSHDMSLPLKPDHYQGVYFMLLAFAVENLLKAAAVTQRSHEYRDAFRATKKFPKELQKHDLIKLAQLVELQFDEREEDLLRRLTRSAVWFGRYPAPLDYSAMSGTEKFLDDNEYAVSWFGGKDVERLNTFITSLPTRLNLSKGYWEGAA